MTLNWSTRSKIDSVPYDNIIVELRYPNDYIIKFSNKEDISQILDYGSNYIKLIKLGMTHHVSKLSDFKRFSFINWLESFERFSLNRVEINLENTPPNGTIRIGLFFDIL